MPYMLMFKTRKSGRFRQDNAGSQIPDSKSRDPDPGKICTGVTRLHRATAGSGVLGRVGTAHRPKRVEVGGAQPTKTAQISTPKRLDKPSSSTPIAIMKSGIWN